jgi:hypothetical protein
MKNMVGISRLTRQRTFPVAAQCLAGSMGVALSLMMTSAACAQNPATPQPAPAPVSAPQGYSVHHSVDLGGHVANIVGSNAMYDTMVNQQSGPRLLGESFEMHALPDNKKPFFDELKAFATGFGGDPNNVARLNFSKNKLYEFSGLFRRDRQYFDYDLLGNPNIAGGQTLPIGLSTAPTSTLTWSQVNQSPLMFNTVRRMTDTNFTLYPVSKVTLRFGYAQNIMQGISTSPSYSFAKYDALLQQNERNSTDDFTLGVDWKPLKQTRVSFEEQMTHYKNNTSYTLAPSAYNVQEANGMKVSLGDWDALEPYGVAATGFNVSGVCSTASMGTGNYTSASSYTFLTANPNGGLPIINPACSVISSYTRNQPTRIFTPTESLRFQSSSIRSVEMSGDIRYTRGNMNLPNYYDRYQGLTASAASGVLSSTWMGSAQARRQSLGADYAILWQPTRSVTLSDQASMTTVHQPGSALITSAANTTITTAGSISINSVANGTSTPSIWGGGPSLGTPKFNYYGQGSFTNNLTLGYDFTNARLAITYHYGTRTVNQGNPHNVAIPNATGLTDPVSGNITINQNGGIFNATVRPARNLDINGSVEVLYDDNAVTAVSPRQTQQYRIHAKYKAAPWAVFTGAYSDRERHNNTNNNQAFDTATGQLYAGPIGHKDYNRTLGLGATLSPNEHYGLDLYYAYSQVYTTTNICYDAVSTSYTNMPGASTASGAACSAPAGHGSTTAFTLLATDFQKSPTQFGSIALTATPVKNLRTNLGYRASSVNSTRLFEDARDVNGSGVSLYQSPFANLAWTVHPGLIWKAEYNYFGYGEGGPGGAQYCTMANPTTATGTATVVPCNTLSWTAAGGEGAAGATAPRTFHANNLTLGIHYEF